MQNWFLYALISMVALAGADIAQKISLTRKENIDAVTNNLFVWTTMSVISLMALLIFAPSSIEFSKVNFPLLLITGTVGFVSGALFYGSFKGNSPSTSIILSNASILITTVLGIMFFAENSGYEKILGVSLIIAAIVIVSYSGKEKLDKYNVLALLGGVGFGFAFTLDKFFVLELNPLFYVFLMSVSIALSCLVFGFKTILKDLKVMSSGSFLPILIAASAFFFYNLFSFLSYDSGGNVGVVTAMNQATVFLVILFEIVILKDRANLNRKILGAIVALIAVLILRSTPV